MQDSGITNAPTPVSSRQFRIMEENYNQALSTIHQQNQDIQRLISALLLQGIRLPGDICKRYLDIDPLNSFYKR